MNYLAIQDKLKEKFSNNISRLQKLRLDYRDCKYSFDRDLVDLWNRKNDRNISGWQRLYNNLELFPTQELKKLADEYLNKGE